MTKPTMTSDAREFVAATLFSLRRSPMLSGYAFDTVMEEFSRDFQEDDPSFNSAGFRHLCKHGCSRSKT